MLMNVTLASVLATPTQNVITLLVISHAHARKAGKETAWPVQVIKRVGSLETTAHSTYSYLTNLALLVRVCFHRSYSYKIS